MEADGRSLEGVCLRANGGSLAGVGLGANGKTLETVSLGADRDTLSGDGLGVSYASSGANSASFRWATGPRAGAPDRHSSEALQKKHWEAERNSRRRSLQTEAWAGSRAGD